MSSVPTAAEPRTSVHITFEVEGSGEPMMVDAAGFGSVMNVAVENNVPGIEGECGGEMSCATCHVYLRSIPPGYVTAPSDDELDMLDVVEDRRDESRLGCQLAIDATAAGLSLVVPKS